MIFLWCFLAVCVAGTDTHLLAERSEDGSSIQARQQAGVVSSAIFLRRAYHGCEYLPVLNKYGMER